MKQKHGTSYLLYNRHNKMNKLFRFIRNHYYLTAFGILLAFVGIIIGIRLLFPKSSTFIFAKVKMGQGLWYAASGKPNIWFINALKEQIRKNTQKVPTAQVISVRYYPWFTTDQFDVYVTVKLRVTKSKTGYTFKRNAVSVGAPIEIELPSILLNGTVIDISQSPFEYPYSDKQIILTKRGAYPWEYDAVKIGDSFSDGEATVFEVTDKSTRNISTLAPDVFGNTSPQLTESRYYLTVKAKIKVKEKNGQFIFGEDQVIREGKPFNFSTSNFTFQDYIVGEIK